MNNRMKEIAGQVLDELVPETWVALGYDRIKEIQFRTAELIVRECMEQVWYDREAIVSDRISESIKERICQHFGVEE